MMISVRVAAAALALLPTVAVAAPWQLDPETDVRVEVPWQGSTVTVRFPPPTGDIDFDPDHPERTRATLTVAASEATTGLPLADNLVRGDGYLATDEFPTITFRLDRLTLTSRQTADVEGEITLRGVTRPLDLKATVIRYGAADNDPARFDAGFDLTGSLDRTAFGSTGGLPDVPAELGIQIRLLMHGAPG